MITYEELVEIAKECGFTHMAPLDVKTIELRPEVRDACAVNTCGAYGKRWSCPPGCGTLEECGARIAQYSWGILVQTVGDIEDSFDFEAMMEISEEHGEHFALMHKTLVDRGLKCLAVGTGGCTKCKECTYPDAPCRFPETLVASMEAYGMVVNEVCKANGMKYNYGPEKMAYTCCFLF